MTGYNDFFVMTSHNESFVMADHNDSDSHKTQVRLQVPQNSSQTRFKEKNPNIF